jgi:predicted TIM-barrel fold metal-dependent hydrolase
MRYFDVHCHCGVIDWSAATPIPAPLTLGEYFGERLVECCRKLDMVVAVNGLGFSDRGYRAGKTMGVEVNDEVERLFTRYPQYVIGMGYVDLDYHTPLLIDELFKRGFKGVKLILPRHRWDHPGYFEFYRRCEYFQMPVLFHTGINGMKSLFKEGVTSYNTMPIFLEDVAVRFPGLPIIGAHLGFAYYEEATCLVESFKEGSHNIHFDLSGAPNTFRKISEGKWIKKEIPPSQLVWGLDSQRFEYERFIDLWTAHFVEIGLTQEEQEQIFFRNACAMFGMKS